MTQVGFYSGSFDPVTFGHSDIIARAAVLVDRLVIGVGTHDAKRPLFTGDERTAMLESVVGDIAAATATPVDIVTFDNLAVDAARANGASIIIRGLRDGTDLDYESQMAGMNRQMAGDIETIYLPASPEVRHIAANLVRQIALMGGDVSHFVSTHVVDCLKRKAANKR